MRRWFFILGLLGCLSAHAAGPVWAIRGEHNTVYLAGSIHLLKKGDSGLPSAFDSAYEDAEALVMEVDLDDLDPNEAQSWMLQNARFGPDKTLREAIGEERYKRLEAEVTKLGLPIAGIEQFEPWMIALTLVQLEYMKLGFDPEQGVEKQLERRARQDGKEITGLETLPEQLGLLDGLPYETQAKFLDLTLLELHNIEKETEILLAAWRGGNVDKLADLLTEEYEVFPELYQTLVTDRNKRWMPELRRLLTEKQDYLVVVGALHLVGEGGLLKLVESEGLKPRQLQ